MAIVHLPDGLSQRLEAEAAARGITVEQLAVEALEGRYGVGGPPGTEPDALDTFIGGFDSGDPHWAGTGTRVLRSQVAARRERCRPPRAAG